MILSKRMPPRVQIIILQYNNSADTVSCLTSVIDSDYENFGVLVIDNGSTSEHVERIKNFILQRPIPRAKFQSSNVNRGYSGGNNIGIKYALENNADYIWILNNDIEVGKDSLAKLVEAGASDPKAGILGPILDEGNRKVGGGKIKWLKPELRHFRSEPQGLDYELEDDEYLPGAAWLIKAEVIGKIGLLDERYFLYFEDAEYSRRTHRAGYKLKIAAQALVHHRVSGSARALGAAKLLRYHYRNAHLLNSDWGPNWAVMLLPVWSLFIIIKQLAKIIFLPGKRLISKAILSGVLDFYFGRFGKIADKPADS